MIREISAIILFVILAALAYQDWKERKVALLLLLLLPLPLVLFSYGEWTVRISFWKIQYIEVLASLSFLILNLLAMWGYLRLRYQDERRNIWNAFGSGDLIFLAILTLGFTFKEFVQFFLVGTLFALAFHLIYCKLNKHARREIPLISYFSLVYFVELFGRLVWNVHLFNFM